MLCGSHCWWELTSHGAYLRWLDLIAGLFRQLPALSACIFLCKACSCAGMVDFLHAPVRLTPAKSTLMDKLRHLNFLFKRLCGSVPDVLLQSS